jgi:hypothetical protein
MNPPTPTEGVHSDVKAAARFFERIITQYSGLTIIPTLVFQHLPNPLSPYLKSHFLYVYRRDR